MKDLERVAVLRFQTGLQKNGCASWSFIGFNAEPGVVAAGGHDKVSALHADRGFAPGKEAESPILIGGPFNHVHHERRLSQATLGRVLLQVIVSRTVMAMRTVSKNAVRARGEIMGPDADRAEVSHEAPARGARDGNLRAAVSQIGCPHQDVAFARQKSFQGTA